jgi:hypothetical protein
MMRPFQVTTKAAVKPAGSKARSVACFSFA